MFRSYVAGLIALLIIDTIWIRFFVKKIYLNHLSQILILNNGSISARIAPALIFYFLFYTSLFYLSVLRSKDLKDALISAFILGLCSYGTYSFTNLAVLKDWNWTIAISDVLWGPLLTVTTVYIARIFL